jgi:predicted lactoylglutathione lyase
VRHVDAGFIRSAAKPSAPPPKPQTLPVLLVRDVPSSLRFYRTLGFVINFAVDDSQCFSQGEVLEGATFASLSHADSELMLQSATRADGKRLGDADVPRPASPETVHLHGFKLLEVLAHAKEAQACAASITTPHGTLEIHVNDPDGHLLCFVPSAAPDTDTIP